MQIDKGIRNFIRKTAIVASIALISYGLSLTPTHADDTISRIEAMIGARQYAANYAESQQPKDEQAEVKVPKGKKLTHFTSGTGFFVNNHYIVTNEHVVKECKYIKVRGAVKPGHATIKAVDGKNDLALLRTSAKPKRIASLRGDNLPIKMGEDVTVIGYPLEHGIKGSHVVKQAVVTDTEDVYDGIKRLQFTDSVEKGNSGGPLLDANGSVVGVVVGKMSFYLANAGEGAKPVKTSSMAINLDTLRNFLNENHIFYKTDYTEYSKADRWMERKAKQYIVNVHCIKD